MVALLLTVSYAESGEVIGFVCHHGLLLSVDVSTQIATLEHPGTLKPTDVFKLAKIMTSLSFEMYMNQANCAFILATLINHTHYQLNAHAQTFSVTEYII